MKLTEEKCFTYHKINGLSYLVVKDKIAGRPDRYTVMILCASDPVVIGRELGLSVAETLIELCEEFSATRGTWWFGDRPSLEAFLADFFKKG